MIIDMRLRPPYRGYLGTGLYDSSQRDQITRSLGFAPAPSVTQKSMSLCVAEMDQAGIKMGVAPGRIRGKGDSVSNEDIIALVKEYPDRFLGLLGVGIGDIKDSLAAIEAHVVNGPLRGINIEPGLAANPVYANDKSLAPIYDYCGEKGIPVMVMIGGMCGPDLSYGNPNLYLHIAKSFPKCEFIIAHGGWPFVPPALGPWFWAKNIYVMPDMYFFNCPGMNDYALAAGHYMQDNFLFATGYPYVPLADGVRMYQERFEGRVLEKLMYGNAARIFQL